MKKFSKLSLICVGLIGLFCMILLSDYIPTNLKASLPFLNRGPEHTDIAIEDVELIKVEAADENYSRYLADITIRNNGRELNDEILTVSSGAEHYSVDVSTKKQQVSLDYGDAKIIEDYELYLDKHYNGEMLTFRVSLNGEDATPEDNEFTKGLVDFENDGLGDVLIIGVNDTRLNLSAVENLGDDFDYFVLYSRDTDAFPEKPFTYREYIDGNRILSFYTAPVELGDLDTLKKFDELSINSSEPVIALPENIYEDQLPHIFILKAVKKDKTIYSFSNYIGVPVQALLNKAEAAKIMVENLGLELDTAGTPYFKDLDEDHWYSPYVKTLLNKGILKPGLKFNPAEYITRGEIAQMIVKARDVSLAVTDGDPHFTDVDRNHNAFYAVEALYAAGDFRHFSNAFMPETASTRAFLHFLLN